jgi:hypothetical protein
MVGGRLGPTSIVAWDELDAFWSKVASEKPTLDPEGKALTNEQYESVERPVLRSLRRPALGLKQRFQPGRHLSIAAHRDQVDAVERP